MTEMDRPTRIRECARLVATSESSLRKMCSAGLLPVLRTGPRGRGVRLIPREVIEVMRVIGEKRS